MKRTFTYALIMAALAALSASGFAQDKTKRDLKQHKQHAQKQLPGKLKEKIKATKHRLIEQLGLSAEQKQRLQILRDQTKASLKALKDQTGDRAAKLAKVRQIRQRAHEQLQSILTPAQKTKLEDLKKSFKGKHQGKRKIGRPGKGIGV